METELIIREADEHDIQALTDIYNHYVAHTHVTFDLNKVETATRLKWLTQFNTTPRHRLFVGVVNDQLIGYACSSQFRVKPAYDRSVETSIYLSPDHTGRGDGYRLYRHLIDTLTKTDVHRLYGVIALPNDASVRLHQKLGYETCGTLTEVGYKFNKYWDTLWMERRGGGQTADNQ